jgi:hypothetical protein
LSRNLSKLSLPTKVRANEMVFQPLLDKKTVSTCSKSRNGEGPYSRQNGPLFA